MATTFTLNDQIHFNIFQFLINTSADSSIERNKLRDCDFHVVETL